MITGASGFIGGHIAAELHKRGYAIRAQYRRENPPEHLNKLKAAGCDIVRCDFSEPKDIGKAVQGIKTVIHAAGYVKDFGPYDIFEKGNVQTTVSLAHAAKEAGCGIFCFLSSLSVHGFGDHEDSLETGPYYRLVSNYQKTKKAAENFVLNQNRADFRCVCLRPGLVYGPGDTTTLKPAFDLMQKIPFPLLGGFTNLTCPIFVSDLVEAVLTACDTPEAAGQVINITSGEKLVLIDAIKQAKKLLGVKKRNFYLPLSVAFAVAPILEFFNGILKLKKKPILTRYLAHQLAHNFHFSTGKATSLLGFRPKVTWKQGLEQAVLAYKTGNTIQVDSDSQLT